MTNPAGHVARAAYECNASIVACESLVAATGCCCSRSLKSPYSSPAMRPHYMRRHMNLQCLGRVLSRSLQGLFGVPERLREARLVAGEAPRAANAVSADFLRISRSVHALIAERLEEFGLEGEREHLRNPSLPRELFDGRDDSASQTKTMRFRRNRNCRDLRQRRRVFLDGATRDDVSALVDRHEVVVQRERDHFRRTAQHQMLIREMIVE